MINLDNFNYGILFVVSSPIGNIKDITYRSIEILKQADIIAVEQILHTKHLLKSYEIYNKILIKVNKNNEKNTTMFLTESLLSGKNIALLSSAGTPCINDPGNFLINSCYKLNIRVEVLPGPCAAISALSISGLSFDKFIYEGFLPKKNNKRKALMLNFKNYQYTILFYESPKRIIKTLKELFDIYNNQCFVVIAKELTKLWEIVYRGLLSKIIYMFEKKIILPKGEFVVLFYIL